jgi:hypothetical protein
MSSANRVPLVRLPAIRYFAAACGAFLLGCTDAPLPTAAPSPTSRTAIMASLRPTTSTVSTATQADARQFARGLALALRRPSLRAHLRHAMRDSRITDHKLVLQEYVQGKKGEELVTEVAAALGSTPDAVLALVRGLPSMDLYVPFRAHRLAWKGSPEIVVAASFEPDAPTLEVYDLEGAAKSVRLADGAPARTLVIMHPSEPTGMRAALEPGSTDEAIQSPLESGVTPFMICVCDEGGGGGGGVTPPAPGVYVTQFYSYRGDGWWGGLEMEFRSLGWEGYPQYLGNGFWFSDAVCSKGTGTAGLDPEHNYTGLAILAGPGITNVAGVACNRQYFPTGYEMYVYESDGGLNGNGDDFGRRFFYGGTIPFAAQIGQQIPYYAGGGTPSDGELSVSMTLSYK